MRSGAFLSNVRESNRVRLRSGVSGIAVRRGPQAVLSFGPSASLHPSPAQSCCFAGCGRKRYCPSALPLRSIPPHAQSCCFAGWSQAVLPFGPSASLHPSHCAALVGPARLRPRVARVRRTTPLRPAPLRPATSIHHPRRAEDHGNRPWQLAMISPSEVSTQLKAGYCGQPPPGARAIHAGGRFL